MTAALTEVKIGDRIKLARDVERFPDFIAQKGSVGRVTEIGSLQKFVAVRMDVPFAGGAEWDNEIHWHGPYIADFDGDVINETLQSYEANEIGANIY